jgi:hypothetical protein
MAVVGLADRRPLSNTATLSSATASAWMCAGTLTASTPCG